MTPPISPCPSLKMSIKGLRSSARTMAQRSSGLSNGATVWLMINVRLPVATVVSQIACGAWFLISFRTGPGPMLDDYAADVRWHDGKPFSPKDVKCTWDLLTGKSSEKLRVNPRRSWYHVVGVERS